MQKLRNRLSCAAAAAGLALMLAGAWPAGATTLCGQVPSTLVLVQFSPAQVVCVDSLDDHTKSEAVAPLGLHDGMSFSLLGTVDAVDYGANVVHLRARGVVLPISITPTTAINVHGQAGSIADIRRGSNVTIAGLVHGADLVASSVTISK